MFFVVVEMEQTFREIGIHNLWQSFQHSLLDVECCQAFDFLTRIQKCVEKSEEELSIASDLQIVLLKHMNQHDQCGPPDRQILVLQTRGHLGQEGVHQAGVPDAHVREGVHDIVLHCRILTVVQDLTKRRDNLLGLFLVLETHLAQRHHRQGLELLVGDKLEIRRLSALSLGRGKMDGGCGSAVRNLKDQYL